LYLISKVFDYFWSRFFVFFPYCKVNRHWIHIWRVKSKLSFNRNYLQFTSILKNCYTDKNIENFNQNSNSNSNFIFSIRLSKYKSLTHSLIASHFCFFVLILHNSYERKCDHLHISLWKNSIKTSQVSSWFVDTIWSTSLDEIS
jgi:hypothetical protein